VVEPVIGDLKTKHGLARAQFRGRQNLQIQALLTAAVFNLKALARWRPLVQAGWAASYWATNVQTALWRHPQRLSALLGEVSLTLAL
jgi:hypothetical protein